MSIETFDAESIGRLFDRIDAAPDAATRYVACLVKNGARSYIDNANVQVEALLIDGRVLPLVIADRVPGNSNICSSYAHYFEYTLQEFARRHPRLPDALLTRLASPLGVLLRRASIDRVVFVNNWLLTTNPRHGLAPAQVGALTGYLSRRFPDSTIAFRSMNPRSDPCGIEALRAKGYCLVPSRRVYMLDTSNPDYLKHRNMRADLRELKRTRYSIDGDPATLSQQLPRITALYRDLYLGKHSALNPQFNTNFFSMTLGEKFLTYRTLVADGRIDGFFNYLILDGVMTAGCIGYDLQRSPKEGLYRLSVALLIAEAAQQGALLNLSAGAGTFKILRGSVAVQEYEAIYDRHLPAHRRLPWRGIQAAAGIASNLWTRARLSSQL